MKMFLTLLSVLVLTFSHSNVYYCSYKFRKSRRKTPVSKTLVQVLSYEFCKSSKNTFFTEHLQSVLIYVKENC